MKARILAVLAATMLAVPLFSSTDTYHDAATYHDSFVATYHD